MSFDFLQEREDLRNEETPSFSEIIENFIESKLYDVRVCVPAKVIEYFKDEQKVTVQPFFKRKYKDQETLQLPQIFQVPVAFPRAGESIISMPLAKGHCVMLICSDRSLENWLKNGGDVLPNDVRHHNLSDAIAYPGLYPFNNSASLNNDQDIIIKNKRGSGLSEIRLKPNGHLQILNHKGYDLVSLIDDLLTEIRAARVVTGDAGTQPLVNPKFSELQRRIRTFKE